MRWLIRIVAALTLAVLTTAGVFYWYVQQLPTHPPQQVSAADSDTPAAGAACLQPGFAAAFQVQTQVETRSAGAVQYQSQLSFRVQLQQRGGDRLTGLATDIHLREAGRAEQTLTDLPFLVRATGERTLVFSAYNDLGLMAQHPLSIIAQVMKNLSVGQSGEVYRFPYDKLQRSYRYEFRQQWQRQASLPGVGSAELQPLWQVVGEHLCLPQRMNAHEQQALTINDAQGRPLAAVLHLQMQVQQIASYLDLAGLQVQDNSNAALRFDLMDMHSASAVHTEEQMWAGFAAFAGSHNVVQLKQAAQYLLTSVSAQDLAETLQNGSLDDASVRDLLFALSLISDRRAEDYLVSLLQALPAGDAGLDLSLVRAMVALAANDSVSSYGFNTLAQIAADSTQTANVRNNALISMGTVVQQISAAGTDAVALSSALSDTLISQMTHGDASSAILAAGNAGLDQLSDDVTELVRARLSSGNSKERFAAATVLARDEGQYDALIQQLRQESSALVSNAIVSGLDADQLSSDQRAQLQALAQENQQLSAQIAQLLD